MTSDRWLLGTLRLPATHLVTYVESGRRGWPSKRPMAASSTATFESDFRRRQATVLNSFPSGICIWFAPFRSGFRARPWITPPYFPRRAVLRWLASVAKERATRWEGRSSSTTAYRAMRLLSTFYGSSQRNGFAATLHAYLSTVVGRRLVLTTAAGTVVQQLRRDLVAELPVPELSVDQRRQLTLLHSAAFQALADATAAEDEAIRIIEEEVLPQWLA